MWVDDASTPSTSTSQLRPPRDAPKDIDSRHGSGNIYHLLARREIAPRAKRSAKKLWGQSSNGQFNSSTPGVEYVQDSMLDILSWGEAGSLRHFSANYCPLLPPPRSTIAAAFSPDGKTLASTHGDHTVKIIDSQTGNCLKLLRGHRRTPWVVRFHPMFPDTLASGSLDHDVRLWNAKNGDCIGSRDFYRPIASIAFHAQDELLAVASGHKLYMWHYNRRDDTASPTVVLKTRRSLRAVHFHPHAAPLLLTAEVNDLDSSDSSMTVATSQGYLRYPPPTVYFANTQSSDLSGLPEGLPLMSLPFLIWPSLTRDDGLPATQQRTGSSSLRLLTYSTPSGQYELLLSPVDPNNSSPSLGETGTDNAPTEMETAAPESGIDAMETAAVQPEDRHNQFFPFGDPTSWELPFLQGWLIGQSQAEKRMMRPISTSVQENPSTSGELPNQDPSRGGGRYASAIWASRPRVNPSTADEAVQSETQPVASRIQSELATSLAAAAAAELPCTVKLRIWPHDVKAPCVPLETDKCRLTIPYAVLCSEMGAHFSPCGRFLAACVACMLPNMEGESGTQSQPNHDVAGDATSPTRHPISDHQVIYELRIYSLEDATFGSVLASRAIRAAHCLTSIQFSPTSEHLLLAYGRRHKSLLKSIVIDGETRVHIYTILEVYRVSDMELVRVLPNAEDEVNVACFHPSVGGGLVYGTKEGKLRILQYDRAKQSKKMVRNELMTTLRPLGEDHASEMEELGSVLAMDVDDDLEPLELFGESFHPPDSNKIVDRDFFNSFQDDFDDSDIN
ncbi:hypothetical protein V2J09_014317 [Rumex salicifolius]